MTPRIRSHVAAALCVLAPAAATFATGPALAAQKATAAAPEVFTISLNADNGLTPGSVLQLAVEGTPKSSASVALGKTNISIPLRETSAGMYRGTYTVKRTDRIDPTSVMTARLTRNKRTTVANFTYPASFQALATMGGAPAQAQAQAPAEPRIERFGMAPAGRIEPGRQLRYHLNGAPGANVTLEIPGVASNIPMREVRPGEYVGTYTVRIRDNADAFDTAVATLRSGNRWVTSRLSGVAPQQAAGERDRIPPTISELTPRNGETVGSAGRTLLSADFDDRGGSGIDPGSVRIQLQGRDITSEARVTADQFAYRSDLPPGRYTAEVTVRDRAGNATAKSWNFEVGGTSMGAAPATMLPLTINSPSNGALVDANGNIRVQGRTAPHATVRILVESISPVMGNRLGVAQNVGSQTVQADRDGWFSAEITPRGVLPVPGARFEVTTTASHNNQTAESKVTLNTRS